MPNAKQIFISHSSQDIARVRIICTILENNGYTCFVSKDDIKPGDNWTKCLRDGINNASAFVVLLSRNSNDSQEVLKEVVSATDNKHIQLKGDWIFTIKIEDYEPYGDLWHHLRIFNFASAYEEPYEEHLNEILNKLDQLIEVKENIKDQFYSDYQVAFDYKDQDPRVANSFVEKATEGLCKKIYTELGLDRTENARQDIDCEEILKILKKTKSIPLHILQPLDVVHNYCNNLTTNTDGENFISKDYISYSMNSLSIVVRWYYSDFIRELKNKNQSGSEHRTEYDVTLCFAEEDKEWIEKNVIYILLRSRTSDNSKPVLHQICNAREMSNENQHLSDSISAIKASEKVIFLLSDSFFKGNLGKSILSEVNKFKTEGKDESIFQILYPGFNPESIPYGYSNFTSISYKEIRWNDFINSKLSLRFIESAKEFKLQFNGDIQDNSVNKTISSVQVTASNRNDDSFGECLVEIWVDKGDLRGTIQKNTIGGIATFDDLYFLNAVKKVRLSARSIGYEEALSNEFSILDLLEDKSSQSDSDPATEVSLPEPVVELQVIQRGAYVILIHEKSLSVYGFKDGITKNIHVEIPIKSIDNLGDFLVVGDWEGRVYKISSTEDIQIINLPENEFVYQIPSDSDKNNEALYVAYWTGLVYKFSGIDTKELATTHFTGIQHFSLYNDSQIICDSEGMLYRYQNGEVKYSTHLEQHILGIKARSSSVIIIGEDTMYHYDPDKEKIISERSGLKKHKSVVFTDNYFSVVDRMGKGAVFDYELLKHKNFSGAENSRLLFMDVEKEYFILQYPNSTNVLLKSNQVVYSNAAGPILLDSESRKLLICNRDKLTVHDYSYIDKLAQK